MFRCSLFTLVVFSSFVYGSEKVGLGSENFHVREVASRRLRRALPFSYFLIANGLNSPDPEIRRRCRFLMERAERDYLIVRGWLNLASLIQARLLLFGPEGVSPSVPY